MLEFYFGDFIVFGYFVYVMDVVMFCDVGRDVVVFNLVEVLNWVFCVVIVDVYFLLDDGGWNVEVCDVDC